MSLFVRKVLPIVQIKFSGTYICACRGPATCQADVHGHGHRCVHLHTCMYTHPSGHAPVTNAGTKRVDLNRQQYWLIVVWSTASLCSFLIPEFDLWSWSDLFLTFVCLPPALNVTLLWILLLPPVLAWLISCCWLGLWSNFSAACCVCLICPTVTDPAFLTLHSAHQACYRSLVHQVLNSCGISTVCCQPRDHADQLPYNDGG